MMDSKCCKNTYGGKHSEREHNPEQRAIDRSRDGIVEHLRKDGFSVDD